MKLVSDEESGAAEPGELYRICQIWRLGPDSMSPGSHNKEVRVLFKTGLRSHWRISKWGRVVTWFLEKQTAILTWVAKPEQIAELCGHKLGLLETSWQNNGAGEPGIKTDILKSSQGDAMWASTVACPQLWPQSGEAPVYLCFTICNLSYINYSVGVYWIINIDGNIVSSEKTKVSCQNYPTSDSLHLGIFWKWLPEHNHH
jgi:hypothetical protein